MKFFLLFLFFSFFGGVVLWNRHPAWRVLLLAAASAFVCYGYLFLNQI